MLFWLPPYSCARTVGVELLQTIKKETMIFGTEPRIAKAWNVKSEIKENGFKIWKVQDRNIISEAELRKPITNKNY